MNATFPDSTKRDHGYVSILYSIESYVQNIIIS